MPAISTPWCCSGEKCRRKARIVMTSKSVRPMNACAPWRPASCSGSAAGRGGRGLLRLLSCRVADHVLDGQTGVLAQALNEIAPQPTALLARERRDDDLVDALIVHNLPRGGVRVGMDDLAVRVDPLAAQLAQRTAQPAVGIRVLLFVVLWRDDQEARWALDG